MTKPDDNHATQGCALLLGWALVTAGASVALGLATHPALGLAAWLTLNGFLWLLGAIASR